MASQCVTIKPKRVCMKTKHCFLKISQFKWSLLLNVEDYKISSPQLFSSEDAKMWRDVSGECPFSSKLWRELSGGCSFSSKVWQEVLSECSLLSEVWRKLLDECSFCSDVWRELLGECSFYFEVWREHSYECSFSSEEWQELLAETAEDYELLVVKKFDDTCSEHKKCSSVSNYSMISCSRLVDFNPTFGLHPNIAEYGVHLIPAWHASSFVFFM